MARESDRSALTPLVQPDRVPHPRGGATFRELPPGRAEEAHAAMSQIHAQGRERGETVLRGQVESLQSKQSSRPTEARASQIESLQGARAGLRSMPSDPMEASVGRVVETANMPIQAVREHGKSTGDLLPVHPGQFYGTRHNIGKEMTEHYFGGDSDKRLRAELATPEWSARTTPQQEVTGASGMLHLLRHGDNIGIRITNRGADLLNTRPRKEDPSSHIGYRSGTGGSGPIQAGEYSFNELSSAHPQAAALLMQHHVRASGLVAPSDKRDYAPDRLNIVNQREKILNAGSGLILPSQHEAAAANFVSSMGDVGYPKAGRSLARYHEDPENFGGFNQHKIGSYTWNIHTDDDIMQAGTHHLLGYMAHGKKWLQAHPEAHGILRAANAHPAWHDPTSTIDVWSGRVASGFPMQATMAQGGHVPAGLSTNPEDLFKNRLGKGGGAGTLSSPSDMGYMWGEEAHRQASAAMAVHVPGIGRMAPPAKVVQSLSWFGSQAEVNPYQVQIGARTLAPTSANDPRSLNSLVAPRLYGRKNRSGSR